MSKIHSTSPLSTPWPFWTGILSQVSKNDDEKTLLLKSNLALMCYAGLSSPGVPGVPWHHQIVANQFLPPPLSQPGGADMPRT